MDKLRFLNLSVGQLGFVVKNLDEAMKNYYEEFGIENWHIYTYGPPLLKFMNYKGNPTSYKVLIGLSYLGNTRIELIQPIEGHTIYTDFINTKGYGLQHLGIYVEDIKKEIKLAEQSGFSVIMEGGGFGPDGDGHFAYLDTESKYGICYELIERPKRRFPPEKIYPTN
ncbi:MAG: VOC family protein [Sphaerochaetaceae bacterium]|nr:VOC family protein [Sphaerochaetaceae bacterium]